MNEKTIKKAVWTINKNLSFYQRKLTYQLELRAESEFENGNLNLEADFYDREFDENDIKKYEVILADLATIKRAIKSNVTVVRVSGTAQGAAFIYKETTDVLNRAGFTYDYTIEGVLYLHPINIQEGVCVIFNNPVKIHKECEMWSRYTNPTSKIK